MADRLTTRTMIELHDRDAGRIGDCWRTAIATVLDLEPDQVPHFVRLDIEANGWDDDGDGWWDLTLDWLWDRGLWVQQHDGDEQVDQPHLASGPGPRGHQHTVAVDADGTIHDPHPSRDGLLETTWRMSIIPADEAHHG